MNAIDEMGDGDNINAMFEYGKFNNTDKVIHHEYHKYYDYTTIDFRVFFNICQRSSQNVYNRIVNYRLKILMAKFLRQNMLFLNLWEQIEVKTIKTIQVAINQAICSALYSDFTFAREQAS